MTLHKFSIDLPSDILLTINESEEDLREKIKISLAIQLYIQEKVTLGKATQISGLSRYQFETVLSENNISISNLSLKDVLRDVEKLR